MSRSTFSVAPGQVPRAGGTSRAAPPAESRIFVDVSVIERNDARTGIQRIVRALAWQLLANREPRWDVRPVGIFPLLGYRRVNWPSRQIRIFDAEFKAQKNDIFLGLDFALDAIPQYHRQLVEFRDNGGHLWFVMYDLLPICNPAWFPRSLVDRFVTWFDLVAMLADGFYCISESVESDLRRELVGRVGRSDGYKTHILPMGWDLSASRPSIGLPPGFDELLRSLNGNPTALMVGTLEPRKGHSDVLAAFNQLWDNGSEFNLVVVGRPGWHTEDLQQALRGHSLWGRRVFWLDDGSDEALARLYAACDGVIIASHGEGFGLPLIEALGYGKPVLARNLPVFHTCANALVTFFDAGATLAQLSDAVSHWLPTATPNMQPITEMPSWADAARAVYRTLGEGDSEWA